VPSGSSTSVSLGFEVRDIEATMTELTAQSVRFAGPVVEGGQERIAHFSYPDGTALYLYQPVDRAATR
jgi:hypothetical protein